MDSKENQSPADAPASSPIETNAETSFLAQNKMALMAFVAVVVIALGALILVVVANSDDDESNEDETEQVEDTNDSESSDDNEEEEDDSSETSGTTSGSTTGGTTGTATSEVPSDLREALEATTSQSTSYQIDFSSPEGNFLIKYDQTNGNLGFDMTFEGETIQMFADANFYYVSFVGEWIKVPTDGEIENSLVALDPQTLSTEVLTGIEEYTAFIPTENINCFNSSNTCIQYNYTDDLTGDSGYITVDTSTNLLDRVVIDGTQAAQMDFSYTNVSVVIPQEALNATDFSAFEGLE